MFQFENVVGMVERLLDQTEPHWANARKHVSILTVTYQGYRRCRGVAEDNFEQYWISYFAPFNQNPVRVPSVAKAQCLELGSYRWVNTTNKHADERCGEDELHYHAMINDVRT